MWAGVHREMDWYKVLEVSPTASSQEIKEAYREQAKKWHPDARGGKADGDRQFKLVGEAFQVLKDPASRAAYDSRSGHLLKRMDMEREARGGVRWGSAARGADPSAATTPGAPRGIAMLERVFGRDLRWGWLVMTPVCVLVLLGMSTFKENDIYRFDPDAQQEKMVLAAFDEKSGKWVQPSLWNMHRLGGKRVKKMPVSEVSSFTEGSR